MQVNSEILDVSPNPLYLCAFAQIIPVVPTVIQMLRFDLSQKQTTLSVAF